MQAIFEIKKCFPNVHKPRPHGELRQFFVAAEEEVWDYAPTPSGDGFVSVPVYILFTKVRNIFRNDSVIYTFCMGAERLRCF